MNLTKIKFLVVDDNIEVRETVVDFLANAGCESIRVADNGKEAWDIIWKGGVDFVISDWEMPEMDGLELLKKVRATSGLENLPFLIVTAPISNEKLKISDAAEHGADAYLIKPFRSRTLIQKISEVLYDLSDRLKKTVVLVDDDDSARDFMLEALRELGFNPVSGFDNATDAYDYLEKHHASVALVISDWEMPNMTGIEFLRKVRINRKLSTVPFIIVTSQTSIEALKIQKALEAEVDSYLMKPFRVEALQTKIKMVLARAKVDSNISRGLENAIGAVADSDYEDADKLYRHVLTLDAKNIDALLGIAHIELRQGTAKSVNTAIALIEKAIECNPRFDRPHIELALAYETSRSIDRSIGVLKEALRECFPQDRIHYHLGRLLLHRGKRDDALPHLEKALELNPKLIEAENLIQVAVENPKKRK